MSSLLLTRDVATRFGVQPATVVDWVESGKIPPSAVVRLGGTARGRLRFIEAELDALLEAWRADRPQTDTSQRPLRIL
jgi:predicted site-specific integrase-resolvase